MKVLFFDCGLSTAVSAEPARMDRGGPCRVVEAEASMYLASSGGWAAVLLAAVALLGAARAGERRC